MFCLLKGDYKSWAKGLRAAGYATDPKYPDKLISYIERFHLNQYDNQVLGKEYAIDEKQTKKPTNAAIAIQDRNLYEVQKGDTLYSISKKFNLMVNELKQKNSITDYSLSIGQKLKVNWD